MKLVYEKHAPNNVYIKIFYYENDIYILDTPTHHCKGLVQKVENSKTIVRLDEWYDRSTKRHKGKSNKLFNHTERWFCYMIEKYYLDNIGKPSKVAN